MGLRQCKTRVIAITIGAPILVLSACGDTPPCTPRVTSAVGVECEHYRPVDLQLAIDGTAVRGDQELAREYATAAMAAMAAMAAEHRRRS